MESLIERPTYKQILSDLRIHPKTYLTTYFDKSFLLNHIVTFLYDISERSESRR